MSNLEKYDCGDHDWEDISSKEDAQRHLHCTRCSVDIFEPFELNKEYWENE